MTTGAALNAEAPYLPFFDRNNARSAALPPPGLFFKSDARSSCCETGRDDTDADAIAATTRATAAVEAATCVRETDAFSKASGPPSSRSARRGLCFFASKGCTRRTPPSRAVATAFVAAASAVRARPFGAILTTALRPVVNHPSRVRPLFSVYPWK